MCVCLQSCSCEFVCRACSWDHLARLAFGTLGESVIPPACQAASGSPCVAVCDILV
jgi:hypothetical protein